MWSGPFGAMKTEGARGVPDLLPQADPVKGNAEDERAQGHSRASGREGFGWQCVSWSLILVGLYVVSLHDYLVFHGLAELFSITVAFGLFVVAWNARGFLENDYLLFVGVSYAFVAFIDSTHTLAYKGMDVFARHDANLPTQLWIVARYMQGISLLVAPIFLQRRLRVSFVFSAYALATILALLSIFYWEIFPDCFIEGIGLTPFKRISEYIICLLLGGSIFLLLKQRQAFDRRVLRLAIGSISTTILSELAFTFYVSVYGLSNLIGHYWKILAFYLMYKAIIETGLRKPFALLFRDLKQSQEALQRAHDELEIRVRERTAELAQVNEALRSEVTERKRVEESLLVYAQRLEAIRDISADITRELDLPKLVKLITRRARHLIGTGTGTVWLWDEEAQVLVPHPGLDDRPWMSEWRIRLGEGVVGTVAQRREGMLVNDYRTSPHALPFVLDGSQITAVLAEPLIYRDRLLGVIGVDNEDIGRPFTEEDRNLLALFATHIAIAIANAQLFGEVRTGHERLQSLSRRLVEVQEAERRHIARELHDEIGQALTGLKLVLSMETPLPTDVSRQSRADAQAMIGDLLARVRELSLDLRPAMLDDLGLVPTLAWHLERYTARTNVQVVFKHAGLEGRRFPPDAETAAYRIVQEALTNVARHAVGQEATVRLWASEDCLSVQIEDRGKGFEPEAVFAAHTSGGLSGMRERAELLGGRMTVESTPGVGTLVTAELPLGQPDRGNEKIE
jgi:signal transduction histidine kinase